MVKIFAKPFSPENEINIIPHGFHRRIDYLRHLNRKNKFFMPPLHCTIDGLVILRNSVLFSHLVRFARITHNSELLDPAAAKDGELWKLDKPTCCLHIPLCVLKSNVTQRTSREKAAKMSQ